MTLHYRHPAQLLLLLRDGAADDFPSLCKAFGVSFTYRKGFTSHFDFELAGILRDLSDVGFISIENLPKSENEAPMGRISVTKRWLATQKIFGFGLREMALVEPSRAMYVEPLFGRAEHSTRVRTDESQIFLLMPFTAKLQPVYDDHIVRVAKKIGAAIIRADDIFDNKPVMTDIWSSICHSDVVIADCTGRNTNVFYEIGLAHAIGRQVVLITQTMDDVPFDLRYIRCIEYEFTPRGMKQFEVGLERTLVHILAV